MAKRIFINENLFSEEHSNFERLIAALKVTSDNLRILHHNLVGGDWEADHTKFAEYYEATDDMADGVIEIAMTLGGRDMSIAECVKLFPSLEIRNYNADEAYGEIKKHFDKLISLFEVMKNEVPGDVYSKFEEHIYWLRLESNYKISRKLGL